MDNRKKIPSKKSNLKAILIVIISIISMLLIGTMIFLALSNHKQIDFRTYFNFGDDIITVKEDKYQDVTNKPQIKDDNLYLSYDYVRANIDEYIFWDDELKKLTITTSDEVIRFKSEDTTYFVNDSTKTLDIPVTIINDVPYVPETLIESLYSFDITYFPVRNIVVVDDRKIENKIGSLKSNATLRYEPNRKGVIENKLKKNEELTIFDEYDSFTKVMTSEGLVGYLKTDELSKDFTIVEATVEREETYATKPIDGNIIMAWDMITNVDANNTSSARTLHTGVNVLSPTWFKFDREKLDGTVISVADKNYVDFAHRNGYMVWGLVSDVLDSYDGVVLKNVLPNSDYRQKAIKQLLSYMTIYELDGLNIDFEMLRAEDSDAYVQFFRELYPYMKAEGKYLSVDMTVPMEWSSYYRRDDVAKSVDYFCIMAYDEHYNGGGIIGPVASIGFVENGIIKTLESVPKEKIILGVPFYTRIWKTYDVDGVSTDFYVADYAMASAEKKFKENNATFKYDSKTGYTYAEYIVTENGKTVTYKAWLEDADSIRDKVELVNKYGIKGVAGWRRGLQADGIFELIDDTVN